MIDAGTALAIDIGGNIVVALMMGNEVALSVVALVAAKTLD